LYKTHRPRYGCNLNSYLSTYHPGTGTLQLYGHHVTAPPAPGGRPEYYMTQIDSYAMTGSSKKFREGAGAFRHVRDLAELNRNSAVELASHAALTDSRSSSSYQREDQSDTSAAELASEEITPKRSSHTSLPSSRRQFLSKVP
jgi:hypothetical protein